MNGVDAITGQYLVSPLAYSDAVPFAKGSHETPAVLAWLRRVLGAITEAHLGLPDDVDPAHVEQAGWAIVFQSDTPPDIRAALSRLIARRHAQLGDGLCKVLEYRRGESRASWLARHGVGAGEVDPAKVPYYLLLVGSPEDIPFRIGHELGVEYAVGRLHFDTADEYARYAESVDRYETAAVVPNAKEVVFFASRHSFDPATQLSADYLVAPLAGVTQRGGTVSPGVALRRGFSSRELLGSAATKSALTGILRPAAEARPPALLFTATHGMGFPCGHPLQAAGQGALLCQDWPGFGSVSQAHYLSAADLPGDARVHGLIAFLFACFGGGTPARDRFFHQAGAMPPQIADRPFLAALPKALLSHPGGGALAVISHVDRAWGYSIVAPNAGPQLLPFRNAIGRILKGQPVGYAMKDFNEKYAALSSSLVNILEDASLGVQVADFDLVSSWTQRNDAEGYVVLGDPAVRLRIGDLTGAGAPAPARPLVADGGVA
ncbi:MAG: hypothetical protein M3O15_01055 [Acidobacteriota bacterium]|nr:hypothetical protein [Acidobacteriota bacterium]